jgi:hypothetical protein
MKGLEKLIFIVVPSHPGGGLGIDTTRLYKLLPREKQYGHSVQMTSTKNMDLRSTRQQDVIVVGISEITNKRWRADVKDGVITLSINSVPDKVFEKTREIFVKDFELLLKIITSQYEIKFSK